MKKTSGFPEAFCHVLVSISDDPHRVPHGRDDDGHDVPCHLYHDNTNILPFGNIRLRALYMHSTLALTAPEISMLLKSGFSYCWLLVQ